MREHIELLKAEALYLDEYHNAGATTKRLITMLEEAIK